jgi:hypothetical protein
VKRHFTVSSDRLRGCRAHGVEIHWIAGARLEHRDVVVSPAAVAREQPATGEYIFVEDQAAREASGGVGQRAPTRLHLRSVEKIQLSRGCRRYAAQIDARAIEFGVRPLEERLRRADAARKAHYGRLSLASVEARRRKRERTGPAQTPPPERAKVTAVTTAFRSSFDVLRDLGVAHVTDACRALGIPYRLADERLRRIVPDVRIAGSAVTLRMHLAARVAAVARKPIEALRQAGAKREATKLENELNARADIAPTP